MCTACVRVLEGGFSLHVHGAHGRPGCAVVPGFVEMPWHAKHLQQLLQCCCTLNISVLPGCHGAHSRRPASHWRPVLHFAFGGSMSVLSCANEAQQHVQHAGDAAACNCNSTMENRLEVHGWHLGRANLGTLGCIRGTSLHHCKHILVSCWPGLGAVF